MSEANGEYPPLSCSPCPFCGNDDLGIGRGATEDREGWPTYVYCATCGAQGPWIYTRDKGIWTCTALACERTGWNKKANMDLTNTPSPSATDKQSLTVGGEP